MNAEIRTVQLPAHFGAQIRLECCPPDGGALDGRVSVEVDVQGRTVHVYPSPAECMDLAAALMGAAVRQRELDGEA